MSSAMLSLNGQETRLKCKLLSHVHVFLFSKITCCKSFIIFLLNSRSRVVHVGLDVLRLVIQLGPVSFLLFVIGVDFENPCILPISFSFFKHCFIWNSVYSSLLRLEVCCRFLFKLIFLPNDIIEQRRINRNDMSIIFEIGFAFSRSQDAPLSYFQVFMPVGLQTAFIFSI